MSTQVWPQVNRFEDGQSLDAKTLNEPIGQLAERTAYLLSRLNQLGGDARSCLVLSDVLLSSEVGREPSPGNVVYLDRDRECFAAARATMDLYDDFTAANDALVVGILQAKNGNRGDVLIYGQMSYQASITISSMIESGEKFRPGRYYLSANEAGKLTADPNGPLIYVCVIKGEEDSRVPGSFTTDTVTLVNPQFLDIGTSHVHRTAVLTARPAGDLSADGKTVVGYRPIMSESATDEDRAEAPSLLFGGTWTPSPDRKVNYQFSLPEGTNVTWASNPELAWTEDGGEEHRVRIPQDGSPVALSNGLTVKVLLPAATATIAYATGETWAPLLFPDAGAGWVNHEPGEDDDYPNAKYEYVIGLDPYVSNYWPPVPAKSAALVVNGVEMDNQALFPDNPTVAFGAKAIYWFEDAEGRKPWPEPFAGRDVPIAPEDDKTEAMHWVRCFQGATGPVTSLQVKPGSPLKIYGFGSFSGANTGNLEIAADFDFDMTEGGLAGYQVPKKAMNGKLVAGPVVERIVAGPGISIISKVGCPAGQGTVTVGVEDGAYRSQFGDIALENAEQAKIGMFPYVRLKGYSSTPITPSAFTATMRVPTSIPDGEYALVVQAAVFGEASFYGSDTAPRVAGVELNYNVLPDYTEDEYQNLKTGLLRPTQARSVRLEFGYLAQDGFYAYDAFDPMVVSTEGSDMVVKPGVVSFAFGKRIPDISDFNGQVISDVSLRPGYLVGLRFSRSIPSLSSNVAYTGALGFINLCWNIVSI